MANAPTLGTKIMATGAIAAISWESWPAPLCISLVLSPKPVAAAWMVCCNALSVRAGLEALACRSNRMVLWLAAAMATARRSIF
jgi:hypothetical protein